MKDYKIEGNIDFFAELYHSLDKDDNETENENICLITDEPLVDNYVKMDCGHKFNYIPLFYDIKNHKQKFNSLEGTHSRLHSNEIRCPYCRNRQMNLLPYYEELGIEKTHGVNFYDPSKKTYANTSITKFNVCQYLTPIESSGNDSNGNDSSGNDSNGNDSSGNDSSGNDSNGNTIQYTKCFAYGYYKISKYIADYIGEDLCVCYSHKNKMVKEYLKKKKDNEKVAAKHAKEEAKANAKKEKEEIKAKAKEDKKKEKAQIKANVENIILNSSIVIHVDQVDNNCIALLKSGPNKGKNCGCKLYSGTFCKRHYKEFIKETAPEWYTAPESNPEI